MTTAPYSGGCQCGAVRFEAELDLEQVVTCNCSRCQRLGSVLTFTPRTQFHLLQGEDALTAYQFNKRVITHLFCATCGIETHGLGEMPDGTPMAAVNVNCLDGVDPRALKPYHHDGRSA